MELVYLWVEEYKNIKNQGFNFSPRFECEFKDGNLTICDKKEKDNKCKNKDYIENFFGKNINVTAIVGENGSGKSRILKIIEDLNSTEIHNTENIYVLIDGKNIHANLPKGKIKAPKEYEINSHTNIEDKLDYFVEKNLSISSTNYKNKEEGEFILASVFEKDDSAFNFINDNYIFIKYKVDLESLPMNFELGSGIEKLDEKLKNPLHEIINSGIPNNLLRDENYYLSLFTLIAVKLLQFTLQDKNLANIEIYKSTLSDLADNFTKENYLNFVNKIDSRDFTKDYSKYLEVLKNFDENKKNLEELIKGNKSINSSKIKEILKSDLYMLFSHFTHNNFDKKFLKIDYLTNKNISFKSLSDGEQQKMVQLGFFIDELLKTGYEDKNKLLLTFDEPDLFLHPNWQKAIINEFMIIINKYINKKFDSLHLILTSHSPFILSDIPKENVIFLKKYDEKTKEKYPKLNIKDLEDGNCINVSEHIELKTFGANIHTLLSDGFFMSDGLMGEFAKSKITEILDFLNNKEKLKTIQEEQIKPIIESIGEDFLREKLLKMYNEKYNIKSKDDEIKELKAEIERLKNVQN